MMNRTLAVTAFLMAVFAMPAQALTLTTTYEGGNGQDGNMFDVVAKKAVTVTAVDTHCDIGVADFEIYGKTGTYVGSDTTPEDWTLLGSASSVTCAGEGIPTEVPISLSVVIPAGTSYAFYITTTEEGPNFNYTNGTAVGAVYTEDVNIQILEGAGKEYPFSATFEPRIWNGTITYILNSTVPVPSLSPLGLGLLVLSLLLLVRRKLA